VDNSVHRPAVLKVDDPVLVSDMTGLLEIHLVARHPDKRAVAYNGAIRFNRDVAHGYALSQFESASPIVLLWLPFLEWHLLVVLLIVSPLFADYPSQREVECLCNGSNDVDRLASESQKQHME